MNLPAIWLLFYFGLWVVVVLWGVTRINRPRTPLTYAEWLTGLVLGAITFVSIWAVAH